MGLKKRLGAFLLCGVIAFHSVCVYTPSAKAAVLESMLANMCLSTFMTATGISLVPDDKTSERLCQALDDLVPDFVTDYAAEVGEYTVDAFNSVIAQDCVIQTTGLLQIGHQAAALLGRFTGWLIDKFGLIGEDGEPVIEPVCIVEDAAFLQFEDGTVVYLCDPDNGVNGTVVKQGSENAFGPFYFEKSGSGNSTSVSLKRISDGSTVLTSLSSSSNYGKTYYGLSVPFTTDTGDNYCGFVGYMNNYSYPEYIAAKKGAEPFTVEILASLLGASAYGEPVSLTASLAADYEAAPTVDEQYAMVIDTGLTYEDEESYIDAVLNGVAAGTLSPTYTIEQTTTGDVTDPDEGTDTEEDNQAGILDWTKKIWQSVKELPGELMDALTNVFVPSAEYTAALPQMVVDTFDSRTGFLTYPFSVLSDFIGRLGDTGDDWIITWPDIDEPFSGGRLISKGQFNVSQFVRSDLTLSNVYSTWMLITKGYLIFLFLELCHRKYKSVVGDRLE